MMSSFVLYVFVLLAVLIPAGIGVDFSPSFTAMFILAFLVSVVLGEICRLIRRRTASGVPAFLSHLFPMAGALLTFPATFIYAAGDDWIQQCLFLGIILAAVVHSAVWRILFRNRSVRMGFANGVENLEMLTAGFFTLACAVPSPALWPYGAGLILIAAGRRLGDRNKCPMCARVMLTAGMLLCGVFLTAPMMF